jgi:hypothetical protein
VARCDYGKGKLMAADQNIGAVSVSITGDYSQLEQDFNATQNIAAEAGQKVAEAFTEAGAPASDLSDKVQALGEDFTGQSAAAGQAATSLHGVSDAAHEVAGSTHEAAGGTGELADELMKLAGVAITAESIKKLGEESILAFGREQQLATSMDLLGAGAEGAAQKVEQLKALSMQLAVPFEQVADTARRMAAAFGTGENMSAVLIAAGNAAAATGRDFETVAQAIERVELTGAVSSRQLMALGLSWKDMAEAMGTSVADAQARLAKGGQDAEADVAAVLAAIGAKFGDAAERQAQNTLGVLTNVKNQAEFIFASIGEDLGPGIIMALSGTMKVAASALAIFIGGVKTAVDSMILSVSVAIEAIAGLGHVAAQLTSGNIAMAATEASVAVGKIKDVAAHYGVELLNDNQKTAEELEKIWGGSAEKIKAAFKPGAGEGGDGGTGDQVKGVQNLTNSLAIAIAQYNLEVSALKAATAETAKYNEAHGTLYTTQQRMNAEAAESARQFEALGNAVAPVDAHLSTLEGETNKLYRTMGLLGKEIDDTAKQAMDATPYGKMEAALKGLGLTEDDTARKTREMKVAWAEYVAANNTDFGHVADSWTTLNTEVDRLAKVNLPAALDMQNQIIASMERMNAPWGQIQAAQQKSIDLWMKEAAEASAAGSVEVGAIQGARTAYNQMASTIASSIVNLKSFGDTAKTILQSFGQEILTQAIGAILKMGETWLATQLGITVSDKAAKLQLAASDKAAVAQHAATIAARAAADHASDLLTVSRHAAMLMQLDAADKAAAAQSDALLAQGQAAHSVADIGLVVGASGVAFAAQYAQVMAAVPYPANLALAPAQAAAAMGVIQGVGIPLATFDMGGLVPEDMIAQVHKGEYISTASDTQRALSGGGGSSEVHIHIDGPVYGVPSADYVKRIMTEVVRQIRLPLGTRTNF